jgi:hypothetical protein
MLKLATVRFLSQLSSVGTHQTFETSVVPASLSESPLSLLTAATLPLEFVSTPCGGRLPLLASSMAFRRSFKPRPPPASRWPSRRRGSPPPSRNKRVDLEEGRPFDQLEGGGVDVARGEVYRQLHLLILPAPLVLGGHVADALPRLQKQSLQNGRALGCKSGGAGAKGVPRVRRAFSSP